MTADDLAKILDELGQRLGPTGQHVFELAVRQVYIDALIELIAGLVVAVACVGTWKMVRTFRREQWDRWNSGKHDAYDKAPDDSLGGGPALLLYILPFAFGTLALILLLDALSKALNPEYAALSDLLSKVVPK